MSSTRCPSCLEPGTFTCTDCKMIRYCSRECQAADFDFHKHFCLARHNVSARPSPAHRLTVVFPPSGDKPAFQWLEGAITDQKEIFGDAPEKLGEQILTNKITGANLGRDLVMYYDTFHTSRYHNYNQAVQAVCAERNAFKWRGPLVAVVGPKDWDGTPETMQDIDLLACSDLVAFFIDYDNYKTAHVQRRLCAGEKVPAVKISCPGELALTNAASAYKAVRLPPMHPFFLDGKAEVAPISAAIGTPLLTWKAPQEARWPEVKEHLINPVSFMHVGTDTTLPVLSRLEVLDRAHEEATFARSPARWTGDLGSVYIARQDQQALAAADVNAFADFCQFHLKAYTDYFLSYVEQEREDGSEADPKRVNELKRQVAGEVNEENWQEYLGDWRKLKKGEEVEARMFGKVRMGLTEEDGDKLYWCLV